MKQQNKAHSFRKFFKNDQKHVRTKNKHWGLLLIPVFIFTLFMLTYFNYTSNFAFNPEGTTIGERFYLSGPDPYYNMRLVEQTLKTGSYPFIQPHNGDADPLLNYPIGERGARPPLFNLIAVGSTVLLQNFMSQIDAQGWSMLFLPCIYGALMIFPLYYIGKELFNRKVGLIAALLLPFVPSFLSSGHGAGFSLFDHDSFIQLLFILVFFFIIKMLREPNKIRSLLYATFAGVSTAGIYLTWVASQMIYLVIIVAMISILIVSLLKNKNENNIFLCFTVLSAVAFLVGLPWAVVFNDVIGFPLFMIGISAFMFCLSFISTRIKIPWILSIPSLVITGFGGLAILYLENLGILNLGGRIYGASVFFFGEGIYGSKISLTIAEAHTIGLSNAVMSVGPILYWLGLIGFCLYIVKSYKEKFKPEQLFIISLFFVLLWLLTTAGRFLNDLIPYLILFSAWTLLIVVDKLNFKVLRQSIKSLGVLKGIRRGFSPLRILGVLFIVSLFLSNGFLALDASVPQISKSEVFGKGHSGVFGQSLGQSYYWSDTCSWLATQDSEISEDGNKPAVMSWWDYGFYLSSQSHHPTVADNYQDGIPPASNFHTAKNEQEAVCVLIIRCIEGASFKSGYKISSDIKSIIGNYLLPKNITMTLDDNSSINKTIYPALDFVNYFEDPVKYAPSYNQLIRPEYGNQQLRIKSDNARYQDCCKLLQNLTDEQVTELYMDIKEETGFDIRYYAVEQYDTQIFNVFSFLADKSTFGFVDLEDDYMYQYYETPSGEVYFYDQLNSLSSDILSTLSPKTNYKQAYFETMFYRTYYGSNQSRIPTYLLKHFSVVYSSPYVIIAKYSEGAMISGSIQYNSTSQPNQNSYPNYVAVVYDQYGIPHDIQYVGYDGTYSLLFPEGNCTVGFMLGENQLNVTKRIPISKDEARRITNHTQQENITVNLGLADIKVITNKTLDLKIKGTYFGDEFESPVVSNQTLKLSPFYPDVYTFTFTLVNGSVFKEEQHFLDTGNNSILLNL